MNYRTIFKNSAAKLLVLTIVVVNLLFLIPELSISRFDLNDSVLHYTLADRMVQAIKQGENPLDFWASEWTLGYPVPRTYQPLGHLLLALLYFILGKSVSLMTLFVWARYLLICLFPLTVYVTGRLLMLRPTICVAAALLSPLISTNGLYGIEYGSYLWRGSGLFTQSLAMHLLLLSLGLAFHTVKQGKSLVLAGFMLGLTFLANLIYGYMGALSVCLLILIPNKVAPSRRFFRVGLIGLVSFILTAFQLVPMLHDSPFINHSRWEPAWKWDSFGASQVLKFLVTGELLDFGRPPSLTLLALIGVIVCVIAFYHRTVHRDEQTEETPLSTFGFILFGALMWLLLFFGRPTWGILLTLLGAGRDVPLHRFIGGLHLFLIFLSGIGLGYIWTWFASRRWGFRHLSLVLMTLALLLPSLRERSDFLAHNAQWGKENLAAFQAEKDSIEAAISTLKRGPGRVYAGLGASWGKDFRVGSVPFYALLSTHHIPAVSFLYHAMALTSNVMVLFDETSEAHYRLFNISTVVAYEGRQLPPFLTPAERFGRFRLFRAPANGYFDLVSVSYAVLGTKQGFYDVNSKWLQSAWVARQQHLLLDFDGSAPAHLPRLSSQAALPPAEQAAGLGSVEADERAGEVYRAKIKAEKPGYLLFKMTYHPDWRATINGEPQKTVMLSPGFLGVAVQPGEYLVEFRYQPGWFKTVLLLLGALGLVLAFVAERRGFLRLLIFVWIGTLVLLPLDFASAEQVPPYMKRSNEVEARYRAYVEKLEEYRHKLRKELTKEAPDLAKKIETEPQKPVEYGYQLLPKLIADGPKTRKQPRPASVSYSWPRTGKLIDGELSKLAASGEKLNGLSKLNIEKRRAIYEKLANDFKPLAENHKRIDEHLQYNRFWQKAIVEDKPRFDRETRLHDAVLERETILEKLKRAGLSSDERGLLIAREKELLKAIGEERGRLSAPGFLKLKKLDSRSWVIEVAIYTDIRDVDFLSQAKRAIEKAWRLENREAKFRVEVTFKMLSPGALYAPDPPPSEGSHLNIEKHVKRFPADGGTLTTGAGSTHVASGRHIVLGPADISRNVLAHEFGHILGFNDGYFRGYRDLGKEGFEVLEIVPDPADIMANAGAGGVQRLHFEKLVTTLGKTESRRQAGLIP